MQERLQKIISRAGVASRRAGEELILAGRVRVNGHVVSELGAKADLGEDTIEVDGRRLVPESARYLVLHKPRGVVSTLSDPEGRPTVVGLLEGAGTRLYPVGRLDFATSGVLLVTNDGDFANGLLHPRGGVPKTYVVKTRGVMTEAELDRWATGVQLEDGKTLPAEIHFLRHEEGKTWFEITLREGKNQQIRRMGEATGFPVMRLARVSFAGITSEGLRPGQWRSLSHDELIAMREQFGVPRKIRGAALGVQGTAGERRVRRPAATPPERHGPKPAAAPASATKSSKRTTRATRSQTDARPRGMGQSPGRRDGSPGGAPSSTRRGRER
jgi:23S rRNA pseudouridine2605 synthase